MKTSKHTPRFRSGFTLLEMTLVIMVSLTIAVLSLALLNQALAFYEQSRSRQFLTEEAPMVGALLAKLISDADRYQMHTTYAAYNTAGAAQSTVGAGCLTLTSFVNGVPNVVGHIVGNAAGNGVDFYRAGAAAPSWNISNNATVTFTLNLGILQTTITGPRGESITYSGAFQL